MVKDITFCVTNIKFEMYSKKKLITQQQLSKTSANTICLLKSPTHTCLHIYCDYVLN